MWDWSGSKTPPPVRSRSGVAEEAQNQGVTPVRRDIRPVPVYRDARAFRTLPPTAPASAYPDPAGTPYSPVPPVYPPQPYAPQPYAPVAPQPYAPQPYAPAPQPYAPQPYAPAPQQPYAPPPQPAYQQPPYAPPAAPQPYTTQGYPQQAAAPAGSPEDRALWEWRFKQTGLVNMDLIEADYVPLDSAWLLDLRKAFKRTRRDFLKYVGYHHVNELLAAGMSEDAIKLVKKGKAPENFNIHIRVPFEYGGTNSFSNLVLIQTHPYHVEIHRFIDMQTLSQPNFKPRKLFLPAPKGKVYFPGDIEISSGGTSRHDRSVYAGFLESTFEMIAQRSSLGR